MSYEIDSFQTEPQWMAAERAQGLNNSNGMKWIGKPMSLGYHGSQFADDTFVRESTPEEVAAARSAARRPASTRSAAVSDEQAAEDWLNAQVPLKGDATQKQIDFIKVLATERGADVSKFTQEQWDSLTKSRASKLIKDLLALPKASRPAPAPASRKAVMGERPAVAPAAKVEEDGMYRNPETGEIYKVQVAVHGSGKLYAKQARLYIDGERITNIPLDDEKRELDDLDFAYVPGLLARIRPEWRMTMEEATRFGRLYGRCVRCHRVLTKESSIEQAMGDICASKL